MTSLIIGDKAPPSFTARGQNTSSLTLSCAGTNFHRGVSRSLISALSQFRIEITMCGGRCRCSTAAIKQKQRTIHVESGLRSQATALKNHTPELRLAKSCK